MLDLTELFIFVDDVCQEHRHTWVGEQKMIGQYTDETTKTRNRKSKMSDSEICTILIEFHRSSVRCFKHYYLRYVTPLLKREFPNLLSYSRFVTLAQRMVYPLLFCLELLKGKCTGFAFADAMAIAVCHNKRISRHMVFEGIAQRGKTTMGWFYGFKIHLVINERGEILAWCLTPGNVDDRTPMDVLTKNLFGKIYADKGYISQALFERLFSRGLELITKVKKNMKNRLISDFDMCMLRKRAVIESVNDQLQNISMIEHTRHRSLWNFMNNVLCALIAYCLQPKKPSLNMQIVIEDREVALV